MAYYSYTDTPKQAAAYGTGNYFTVKELKELIKDLPDDMPVVVTTELDNDTKVSLHNIPTLEVREINRTCGRDKGTPFTRAFIKYNGEVNASNKVKSMAKELETLRAERNKILEVMGITFEDDEEE